MRSIVASQFLTLDGVMESPEKWNANYLDDAELVKEIIADFNKSDSLLFGRTTYEFFAARWPSRAGQMADLFNALPKYVVSTSLKTTAWNNSKIISGDAADEIKKLKEMPGKNMLLFGSHQLLQMLILQNLIDEYKLYIYPLTAGVGKRLFEDGATRQNFKVVASTTLATGVVAATYQPKINL